MTRLAPHVYGIILAVRRQISRNPPCQAVACGVQEVSAIPAIGGVYGHV
jgi:hypothetical protein